LLHHAQTENAQDAILVRKHGGPWDLDDPRNLSNYVIIMAVTPLRRRLFHYSSPQGKQDIGSARPLESSEPHTCT